MNTGRLIHRQRRFNKGAQQVCLRHLMTDDQNDLPIFKKSDIAWRVRDANLFAGARR